MVRIHVRPPAISSEIAILTLLQTPLLQPFCHQHDEFQGWGSSLTTMRQPEGQPLYPCGDTSELKSIKLKGVLLGGRLGRRPAVSQIVSALLEAKSEQRPTTPPPFRLGVVDCGS